MDKIQIARGSKGSTPEDRLDHIREQSYVTATEVEHDLNRLAKKLGKSPLDCANDFVNSIQIISISQPELGMAFSETTPSVLLGSAYLSISSAYHAIETNDYDLFIVIITSSLRSLAIAEVLENGKDAISNQMRKNAQIRLLTDPKQLALKEIEKEFLSVKNQFKRRGYTAQFVREMGGKYPIIESYKTIEKLVSELKKKYPAD